MKQIKLLQLTLQNFKGIKSFSFEPQGRSVTVSGANGSGKTTLVDALWWLLFGKDSQGKADFDIKPIDAKGKKNREVNTIVSAVLAVNDEEIDLKKVLKATWDRDKKKITGSTIEYTINGAPVRRMRDYDDRVKDICDEVTFKSLTSTTHFCTMKWQDMRKIILEICGDISQEDVLASKTELSKLPNIIGKLSVDNYLAMAKKEKKELEDRIKEIPIRIDEAEKLKPELPGLTMGVEKLRHDLKTAQDKRAAILAGDNKHLRDRIAELEKQKKDIEDRNEQVAEEEKSAVKGLEHRRDGLVSNKERIETDSDRLVEEIKECDRRLETFRAEYKRVAAEEWDGDGTCATCGQALPETMIEQALANFNNSKAERKAKNQEQGKALAKKKKELTDDLSGLVDHTNILIQDISTLTDGIENRPEVETESTALVISQIAEIQQKIDSAATPDTKAIDDEIQRLEGNIEEAEKRKTIIEQIESIDINIAKLKTEWKKLATQKEKYENGINLCDQFNRTWSNMLEAPIAKKFAPLKFRMFRQQENGGLRPVCDLIKDGKPYSTISNGEKVQVGLQVIEVLVEHYGISAPVFVDNSESVTLPIKTDRFQQIFLKAEEGRELLAVKQDEELALIN